MDQILMWCISFTEITTFYTEQEWPASTRRMWNNPCAQRKTAEGRVYRLLWIYRSVVSLLTPQAGRERKKKKYCFSTQISSRLWRISQQKWITERLTSVTEIRPGQHVLLRAQQPRRTCCESFKQNAKCKVIINCPKYLHTHSSEVDCEPFAA